MPGGGGVVASNHVYNVAPHDGTTLIVITSTFAIEQLLDTPQIKYDARKFQAIGRLTDTTSTVVYWHTSQVKNAADLITKPTVVAVSSMNEIFAARFVLMNRLLGAKIKLVPGYPSGRDYYVAAQRGEVEGFWNPYLTVKQFYSSELKEKKLNIVLQSATVRDKELPDVPTMIELSNDPDVKQMFRHLGSNDEIGRSLFTTPDVPAARVALLRSAFQKMMADSAFRAEAEKLRLPLSPRTGDEVQKIVLGTFDASPALLTKIRELTKQ
jgi:tripartite-type tricarboxylate transporter receptor subunit TctC